MHHRRLIRLAPPLRHAAVWVVVPALVATLVYLGLWRRFEQAQAASGRLPAPVAAQLARLPAPVSSIVAIALVDAESDPRPRRAAVAAYLRSAVVLADAPGRRVRARTLGARTAVISFSAGRGRAGCAAVRFRPAPVVRVAYAATRRGACASAERRLGRAR
jgi:hypothetical protein